jgi:hypothetical protein
VVAGCGASDGSPNQPATSHSERGKHVLTTSAPHLASGSGSVVRLCLGQPPDPHVIRPPCLPASRKWYSAPDAEYPQEQCGAGRRAERAKREALPCKNDALRRSGRLERRWRQTVYDRAGCLALCRRHLRAGLRVVSGTGHPDRSRTPSITSSKSSGSRTWDKRFRARLCDWPSAEARSFERASGRARLSLREGLGRTAYRHQRFECITTSLEWLRCGESHSGVGPKRCVHGSCGISGVRTRPHSCERTAAPAEASERGRAGEPNA